MVSGNIENAADNEQTAEQSESAGVSPDQQAVKPKHSRAVSMWLFLIFAVLLTLGLQMHSGVPIYNFLVESDATAVGASVSVDGNKVGEISSIDQSGLKGFGVRAFVPSGDHQLTITKSGFKPYTHKFELRGETYMSITLQPVNAPTGRSVAAPPAAQGMPPSGEPKEGETIQLPGPSNGKPVLPAKGEPKDGQTIQLPGPSK